MTETTIGEGWSAKLREYIEKTQFLYPSSLCINTAIVQQELTTNAQRPPSLTLQKTKSKAHHRTTSQRNTKVCHRGRDW